MSRNGAGIYSLPAGNPVVTGTTIQSSWANNTLTDIATALTGSIAANGETPITANLPMAGFKHTGVGASNALTDYARTDQTQNSSFQWLTTIAGTNTITATATPTPSAYIAGQKFRFIPAGANTGAVTLNISGLGAKAVTKHGATALVTGDIPANCGIEVVYDGTQFQLINNYAGNASQTFSVAAATNGSHAIRGSQLFGFRNKLINGCGNIAQRGSVTPNLADVSAYTVDRWSSFQAGAACVIARAAGFDRFKYAVSITSAVGNTQVSMLQCIESINCNAMAVEGMTLSVWLYSIVAKSIDLVFATPTTTDDTFGLTTTNLPSGSLTYSHTGTGWEQATFTYTAALAQANATAIKRGIRVQINFGACASGTFGFTGAQLEVGPFATEYENPTSSLELAMCRYYYRASSYYVPATTAQNLGTIDMRTIPTIAGGGAGFTSTGTTADTLIAFQTTGAVQALTLSAEL